MMKIQGEKCKMVKVLVGEPSAVGTWSHLHIWSSVKLCIGHGLNAMEFGSPRVSLYYRRDRNLALGSTRASSSHLRKGANDNLGRLQVVNVVRP
jgi:hypothetical protein